MTSCNV